MSDQRDAGSLPELTPEQDAEVRRLLAAARHDEPVPIDVADRLDRVLAGLSRDEPGSAGVAPVIDLAARRRRRNAAALLAGAAAVIVAGFGIGQVIDVGGADSGDGAGSTAANADREQAEGGDDAAPSSPDGASSLAEDYELFAGPPLELSSQHLERDVTTQLSEAAAADTGKGPAPEAAQAVGCASAPPSAYGVGEFFPALYDGIPAVLALRPPTGTTQEADVLECGTGAELDSVTIPRR